MEEVIKATLLAYGEAIAGGLPIAEDIAKQLRMDYETLYNQAGKPFGDSLEGLHQYILNTKFVVGEDE